VSDFRGVQILIFGRFAVVIGTFSTTRHKNPNIVKINQPGLYVRVPAKSEINSNFREVQIPVSFLVIFVLERLRKQFFTCYQRIVSCGS